MKNRLPMPRLGQILEAKEMKQIPLTFTKIIVAFHKIFFCLLIEKMHQIKAAIFLYQSSLDSYSILN